MLGLGVSRSRSFIAALAGVASIVLSVVVLRGAFDASSGPFRGTSFDGSQPDRSGAFSDWLELERRRFGSRTIRVSTSGFAVDFSAEELGIEVDVAEMLQIAERQTRRGSAWSRLERAIRARMYGIDHVWVTRFDRERARAKLNSIAPAVAREPVDAEVDLVRRRFVRAVAGAKLDVDATLDFLESHRSVDFDWLPLIVVEVPPRLRDEDASAVDVTRVLAQFETDFRTRAGTRAVNIRVAARALLGQVIGPGEVFSFNRAVGPRLESRGYLEAPVIVDDELEPGVGGGVCQVATTLHAAAVLGGFEILERRSHSRPSGYAPLGLDATVIDGEVDLKLRNPYRVPISIVTSFPQRFRLRIELLGAVSNDRIEHAYAIGKRYDFYRRVVTKPELAAGSFQRKQKGNYGFEVTSTITTSRDGAPIGRRQYRSRYWPVPEVYWVGPNTELTALPALPAGATGVQLDGATVEGTIPAAVEERAARAVTLDDSLEQ